MSTDPTISQGGPERLKSQEMSLRRGPPPCTVPGYELERFLGAGAYGEVWVAIERNTGRRVAIKFYAHRGGLDWSLLSREVEKLAFLFADRYVVQLIGVGWDAEPPYYIMEFLEQGSLAERLQYGALPATEAVALFRDVAVGLVHAHGKGVLHCDLKPANILLDQDGKPRLADFGQSRLSHEQTPALGTLFYMAPEQADLAAVPDARWDVYALGALLYCMLTGEPPHRTDENVALLERTTGLEQRLALYRRMIRKSPPPTGHCQAPGVDRALAEIVQRCLEPNPDRRYPNVQAVLDALDARAARRARRPALVLGAVGPLLLLAVVSLFAWQGFRTAVRQHEAELTQRAQANNHLNALRVADVASRELQRRFEAVEQAAASADLHEVIAATADNADLAVMGRELSDPKWAPGNLRSLTAKEKEACEKDLESLREKFRRHPGRQALQRKLKESIPGWMSPPEAEGEEGKGDVSSWFFCDAQGLSAARVPESRTIGGNYAWRSFFHQGDRDEDAAWRPAPEQRLNRTRLSAVFQSQASGNWIVAMSTPVFDRRRGNRFLGVIALTVRVNRFVELKGNEDQFAVLVDLRPGDHTGLVLQHPLYDKCRPARPAAADPAQQADYRRRQQEYRDLLGRLQRYRLPQERFPESPGEGRRFAEYEDPLAAAPEGEEYARPWLACLEPVSLRGQETQWAVIVQESYDSAIGAALGRLRSGLIGYGLAAAGMVLVVLLGLWVLALRLLNESAPLRGPAVRGRGAEPSGSQAVSQEPSEDHGHA
jgi:type II secretory pathway component PulM